MNNFGLRPKVLPMKSEDFPIDNKFSTSTVMVSEIWQSSAQEEQKSAWFNFGKPKKASAPDSYVKNTLAPWVKVLSPN